MTGPTPLAVHTVTGTVRWAIGEPTPEQPCTCCRDVPGVPEHCHVYGVSLDLPPETPGAAFHAGDQPNLRDWLYHAYAAKRAVPNHARVRVTVEVLPPEGQAVTAQGRRDTNPPTGPALPTPAVEPPQETPMLAQDLTVVDEDHVAAYEADHAREVDDRLAAMARAVVDAERALHAVQREHNELTRLYYVEIVEGSAARVIPAAIEKVEVSLAAIARYLPEPDYHRAP